VRLIALIFAVATGILTLLGFFIPSLAGVKNLLLGWAMILAGVATLVGVFNLVLVHGTRIHNKERGAGGSVVLLVSLFATLMFGLMLGPDHATTRLFVNTIIVPAESTLMALLAVSLIYGSIRLLRNRLTLMSGVFLGTALLMLAASATLPFGEIGVLSSYVRPWFLHVLGLGGARGLLIGVALGTLLTGLRVLVGADRPYEGG
jgi:hypothetical protein